MSPSTRCPGSFEHRPRPAAKSKRRVRRRAFTLVEMLVAVGAVALIAVGLAQVFGTVSQTVRAGKRSTLLIDSASQMERMIRDDVSRMTRQGFLVIRNDEARRRNPAGQGPRLRVPLSPNDLSGGRPRRIDEIVFFTLGEFTTAREPVSPERRVSAQAARIYYGHGLRAGSSFAPLGYSETRYPPRGVPGGPNGRINDGIPGLGIDEPGSLNRYASDWILLRHQTALVPVSSTRQDTLTTSIPGVRLGEEIDSPIQIAMQPAATSIFMPQASLSPQVRPTDPYIVRDGPEGAVYPAFESGLVDIATTDLTEIRSIVLDAQHFFGFGSRRAFVPTLDRIRAGEAAANTPRYAAGDIEFTLDTPTLGDTTTSPFALTDSTLSNMKRWMRSALPAHSDVGALNNAGGRIRCELAPPDPFGTLRTASPGLPFTSAQDFLRADQAMLSSSNWVVGCSEFIVEWSFGQTYPLDYADATKRGQVIWHGMPRGFDSDGDGDEDVDSGVAPFPPNPITPSDEDDGTPQGAYARAARGGGFAPRIPGPRSATFELIHQRDDGQTGSAAAPEPVDGREQNYAGVMGQGGGVNQVTGTMYSYFGFLDPVDYDFIARQGLWLPNAAREQPIAPSQRVDELKPGPRAWPWPKLIRFSITLTDPKEPTLEQTFQFVVEVPESRDEAVF